jgi:hypothetical protein
MIRFPLAAALALLAAASPHAARAQGPPAADAPLARHVDYLVQAADSGFAAIKGEAAPNFGPHASSYRMRFGGHDFAARIQELSQGMWGVQHVLKATPAAAAADSLHAAMAAELDAAVPDGWSTAAEVPGRRQWRECGGEGFRGRMVVLRRVLDAPAGGPFVQLDVFRFRAPCSAPAASSRWAPAP